MNTNSIQPEALKDLIVVALDAIQAHDIKVLPVSDMTDMTDYMIIATGRSDRHVKAVAGGVVDSLLEHNIKVIGKEGLETAEWVLLDFSDAVVHIMRRDAREFYDLDSLWDDDMRQLVKAQREGKAE